MRYSQQECLSFMTTSTREVDVAMPDEGQMPVGCDEFIGKQWSWPLPITHWTHSWGLGAWNGWQQDCPILAFFSCGFTSMHVAPCRPRWTASISPIHFLLINSTCLNRVGFSPSLRSKALSVYLIHQALDGVTPMLYMVHVHESISVSLHRDGPGTP